MAKGNSIAKNSIYYLAYQVLNVLFPFISAIYVARILLPAAVGRVSYAQNIARYFSILAFLGLPTYGLREISRARDDKEELNHLYSELFVINAVSTTVFSIIYLVIVFSVTEFHRNLPLYLITGSSIALNYLNISWLYEGLEEFKYISIRNIVFKILCFILLIVLVRSQKDYLKYAMVTVIGTAGNFIINMIYAPKFVCFTTKNLNYKRHLRPIFALVAVNLAIELYSMVDTTMLGILAKEENVGYYTYAHKINSILIQIINTFTIVVVPRLAFYYKENRAEDFNSLITKTFEIIFILSMPMIVAIQIMATDAVIMLYGDPFKASATVLRIISLIMVISPVGYLLGSRTLLVTGNEKSMMVPVWIGAIVNIIGNAVLIPHYVQIGAAAASVISELCVMIIYVMLGKKYYVLDNCFKDIWKIAISALSMGAVVYIVGLICSNLELRVVLQALTGIIVFFMIATVLNVKIVKDYIRRVLIKLKIAH